MFDQVSVGGDDILGYVEVAIVAHDRIQDPEEATRLELGLLLEIFRYPPDRLDGRGAGDVSRQHHVECVEIGLPEALVQIRDLLCRYSCSFPLLVAGVVTLVV